MNSCLSLAMFNNGKSVTTIEGLAKGDELHPLQEAFVVNDAMQCGYCTPGQIMSGIACIREKRAGSREDIQRYMAGNICRCGAYQNIVDAIASVQASGKAV
jgi:xanthine dehydrogenase YagT iron-sulfur-binding subunit